MPIRKAFLLALFFFVVLALSWFVFFLKWWSSLERHGESESPQPTQETDSGASIESGGPSLATPQSQALAQRGLGDLTSTELSVDFVPGNPGHNRQQLNQLRAYLASLPQAEAIAWLSGWLETGRDAPTGLRLELGAKGRVEQASSLRVFLLEELAHRAPQLAGDRAAAAFERALPESADEFALHLRNYARAPGEAGTHGAQRNLERQMRRLADNPAWLQQPGVGFLEAFDVWVYLESGDGLPYLVDWLANAPNGAVGHAAYLTLERLVDRRPAETLPALVESDANPAPTLARDRASLWARAHVEDPRGQALVEDYLLGSAATANEREAFYQQLPNLHFSHSHNLLSDSHFLMHDAVLERLNASRELLRSWQNDARFAADHEAIARAQRRLLAILGQN